MLTVMFACPRSLHDKATSVLPDLTIKPSSIVVAVLHSDKDANAQLYQGDFLWIKCSAVS